MTEILNHLGITDIGLFETFVVLNIFNVIIQTIKSRYTIKGNKAAAAALVNALAYGLYPIVVVYMVCDLPLWLKVVVVGSCKLAEVHLVHLVKLEEEEKARKNKLWKIEMIIHINYLGEVKEKLSIKKIPFNYVPQVGQYTIFNIYCRTPKQSAYVREFSEKHGAKFLVSETKSL